MHKQHTEIFFEQNKTKSSLIYIFKTFFILFCSKKSLCVLNCIKNYGDDWTLCVFWYGMINFYVNVWIWKVETSNANIGYIGDVIFVTCLWSSCVWYHFKLRVQSLSGGANFLCAKSLFLLLIVSNKFWSKFSFQIWYKLTFCCCICKHSFDYGCGLFRVFGAKVGDAI